jgi:hypothetical protein
VRIHQNRFFTHYSGFILMMFFLAACSSNPVIVTEKVRTETSETPETPETPTTIPTKILTLTQTRTARPSHTPSPTKTQSPTLTSTRPPTFEISGASGWHDTGIQVKSGDVVNIEYISGKWACRVGFGPELPDIWADAAGIDYEIYYPELNMTAKFCSLIGKVGNNHAFSVEKEYQLTSFWDGNLFLRVHDIDMSDNEGSVIIAVSREMK